MNARVGARGSRTRLSSESSEGRGASCSVSLGSHSEEDCGIPRHLFIHAGLFTVPLNNAVELRQLMNSPQTQHSENDAINCPGAVKLLCSPVLLMKITDRTPVCV